MIYEIVDKDLELLLESGNKGKYKSFSKDLAFMKGLRKVFAAFDASNSVDDLLYKWSFLHYERLKGNMSGYSSCRIVNSSPFRLIIKEREDKLFISILRMEDYHNGK